MFEVEKAEISSRLKKAQKIADDPNQAAIANSNKFKAAMQECEDRERFLESAEQCLKKAYEYVGEDGVKAFCICMEWFDNCFKPKNMWHVQSKKGKNHVENVWLREVSQDKNRMEPLLDAVEVFDDQTIFTNDERLREKLQALVTEMVKLVIDMRKEYVIN